MRKNWYSPVILQPHRMRSTATGGVAAPFFPTTLPNPGFIFDSMQSSNTQSGGVVSQWNDLTTNNNHCVQSTLANRPAYNASGINGHPSMTISGSPVGFSLTSAVTAGACTVYIVATILAGSNYNTLLYGTSPSTWWAMYQAAGPIFPFEFFVSTNIDYNFGWARSTPFVFSATTTNDGTAGSMKPYNAGVLQTRIGGSIAITGSKFTSVGLSDSAGDWFKGEYGFVAYYSSVHSDADRNAMESYLATRFA